LYVEPSSVELIHHAIVTALNRKKNGGLRDHIKKEFLWERVAEKTLKAYEEVLAQK
jgi:glycosyltransferase involved in cell wall biosynthesis